MRKVITFKKILYAIRWQISGLVLIPTAIFFGPLYGVLIGNLIGAIIFWNVDKWLTKAIDKRE